MTDEFWHGIWWVRDVNGGLRDATLSECATEIQRLRGNIETQRRTIAALQAECETLRAHIGELTARLDEQAAAGGERAA